MSALLMRLSFAKKRHDKEKKLHLIPRKKNCDSRAHDTECMIYIRNLEALCWHPTGIFINDI